MSATTALEVVVNTVTIARVSNGSVREQKNDVLLVVPDGDSQAVRLEDIARRRDVFRSLPDPLGSFPMVCRVVSDDVSNSRACKTIPHHHDPLVPTPAPNPLARPPPLPRSRSTH